MRASNAEIYAQLVEFKAPRRLEIESIVAVGDYIKAILVPHDVIAIQCDGKQDAESLKQFLDASGIVIGHVADFQI